MTEVSNNPTGQDSIKGGIFFGSNLTPASSFKNIPNQTEVLTYNSNLKPDIVLTLERVRNTLQTATKVVSGNSQDVLSDQSINTFLTSYTQLLIDYEDLRNFVFFGSAYTELNYNIDWMIKNYPYKAYAARSATALHPIEVNILPGNQSEIIFRHSDLRSTGNMFYDNSGKTIWAGASDPNTGYDFVDKSNKRYPVVKFTSECIRDVDQSAFVFQGLNYFTVNLVDAINQIAVDDEFIITDESGIKIGKAVVSKYDCYDYGTTGTGVTPVDDVNVRLPISVKTKTWSIHSLAGKKLEVDEVLYDIVDNDDVSVIIKNSGTSLVNKMFSILEGATLNPGSFTIRYYYNTLANSTAFTNDGTIFIDSSQNWNLNQWVNKRVMLASKTAIIYPLISESDYTSFTLASIQPVDILHSPPYSELGGEVSYFIYDFLDHGNFTLVFSTPGDAILKYTVEGAITINNFVEEIVSDTTKYEGLIISPKQSYLSNFYVNLAGVQKALLSPLNPVAWPREPISNNIIVSGDLFNAWISDPNNMVKDWSKDQVFEEVVSQYPLVGAATLDETYTNQLLRRCIPNEIINELNETDQRHFSRFVLLAGKLFDVIKVYIDFLKYTHTLNYTKFNQLSPEFYKQYADHYGFALLDDDNVDLAKSLIFQEPGIAYDVQGNAIADITNQTTVRDLINEKTKRLLISLFYLYQKKGTVQCIYYLTNLLGAPEGLVLVEEYYLKFDNDAKIYKRTNDTGKINIPQIEFEVDTNYLNNPDNINDPINLPYVYKYKLSNQDLLNLREVSIGLDPMTAIVDDIIKYGKLLYPYGYFGPKTFGNLQRDDDYYFLPLTFPDKYCGISVNYNIPRVGMEKNTFINLDEISYNLCSLYKIGVIEYEIPVLDITVGAKVGSYYPANIEIQYYEEFSSSIVSDLLITNATEVMSEDTYHIQGTWVHDIIRDRWQIPIYINELQYFGGIYSGKGTIVSELYIPGYSKIKSIKGGTKFNYKIPPLYFDPYQIKTNPSIADINNMLLTKDCVINYPVKTSGSAIMFHNIPVYPGGTLVAKITTSGGIPIKIGETIWKSTLKDSVVDLVNAINGETSITNFKASYVEVSSSKFNVFVEMSISSNPSDQPYKVSVETNKYTDVTNVSITYPTLTEGVPQFEADEYIITRMEGNSLVVRLRLVGEHISSVNTRVAIFDNFFIPDGLNHQVRLMFRPKGVEVYKDFEYVGFALWRRISNPSLYNPRTIPKKLIYSCTPTVLSNLFGEIPSQNPYGEDIPHWWDMMVGEPLGTSLLIYGISIFENLSINQNDSTINSGDTSGFEREKFTFDFTNQIMNISSTYITDKIEVPCSYIPPIPVIADIDINLATFIDSFFAVNTSSIRLTSKNLNNSIVEFIETTADFFKHDNVQIDNELDFFRYNAYSPSLHKDYRYNTLDSAMTNYYTFSDLVFTYSNLLPFMEMIENKFRGLVLQFIPIVVNMIGFGKVLRNYYDKVRYVHADYYEEGCYSSQSTKAIIKIVTGDAGAGEIVLRIKKKNSSDVLSIDPIAHSNWEGSNTYTNEILKTIIDANFINCGGVVKVTVDENYLTIEIDPILYKQYFDRDISNDELLIDAGNNVVQIVANFGSVMNSDSTCSVDHPYLLIEYSQNIKIQPETGIYIYEERENGSVHYPHLQNEGVDQNLIFI